MALLNRRLNVATCTSASHRLSGKPMGTFQVFGPLIGSEAETPSEIVNGWVWQPILEINEPLLKLFEEGCG